VRFFDAVRHADFSQRFELKSLGTGFDELGSTFTDILKRIQAVRVCFFCLALWYGRAYPAPRLFNP
jgi:hypothetical protein